MTDTNTNALPLFNHQPVAFDSSLHGALSFPAVPPNYRFAANADVIPLQVSEVAQASFDVLTGASSTSIVGNYTVTLANFSQSGSNYSTQATQNGNLAITQRQITMSAGTRALPATHRTAYQWPDSPTTCQ